MQEKPVTPSADETLLYGFIMKNAASISSAPIVAALVAQDSQIASDMSSDDHDQWLALAVRIHNAMLIQDEARFTLYDYLDACVHSPGMDWKDAAKQLAIITDEKFAWLADLAQAKRDTYSADY